MIDLDSMAMGQFVGYTDHLGEHRGVFQGVSVDRLAIVRMWSTRLGRFHGRNSYLYPAQLRIVDHTLDATVEPNTI